MHRSPTGSRRLATESIWANPVCAIHDARDVAALRQLAAKGNYVPTQTHATVDLQDVGDAMDW